ncbi:hypothetical protein HanLR1_Chr08g0263071 [Helianthus annuus]|nr:hypothetical protein HanLR1_Chr08g0263071 [Helianthus annuus]
MLLWFVAIVEPASSRTGRNGGVAIVERCGIFVQVVVVYGAMAVGLDPTTGGAMTGRWADLCRQGSCGGGVRSYGSGFRSVRLLVGARF